MRRFVFAVVLLAAVVAAAQEKPRNDFGWARLPYRLDYVVRELDDGKVVNSRSFSMSLMSSEERGRSFGELKAGSRVPVNVGDKGIQYADVGVNISSHLYVLQNGGLLLENYVDITSLATPESQGLNPIIRGIKANITAEIPAGKAAQIAMLDDPVSKRRFQIEVTATKQK